MKDIKNRAVNIWIPNVREALYMITISVTMALIISACDTTVLGSFIGEDAITISRFLDENQDTYSQFWKFLLATDLKNTLNAYNPNGSGYTLFLPTNQAFDNYFERNEDYSSIDELLADSDFANLLIRYHLVNIAVQSNDFPFGALPDTTVTGDFLTVGFDDSGDSTVYKINNQAPVTIKNIELINGYIHVIGEILEPVTKSSFDWIEDNPDYSIITEALRITGLYDTLRIYRTTSSGKIVDNRYTLLVEADSIFIRRGILNFNDLVERYGSSGLPLTDYENGLYQFAAYHIMEGSYFLDKFDETSNYNTYANFPVQVATDLEIMINPGKDTIDLIIEGQDTTVINYVRLDMINSNILTKNGPLHLLKDILEVKSPSRVERTFQFYEEPQINDARGTIGEYVFSNQEDMEVLSWFGPDYITYVKSSPMSANNNDYIELEGNFTIDYQIPKILPGKYLIKFKAQSKDSENANIQVSFDGKRLGSSFDLTSWRNPYNVFSVGIVEFQNYETHIITVNSLLPGKFTWDFVRFTPE
jgi:uncharacterized surface protein with fasciclin (FAS1) repeats